MLWSTAYLESRLPSPLPTKDGGNLYAVKDVRAYVLGLAHSRSGHLYWQRAHQLLLDQADVVTLRRQVELALFCDGPARPRGDRYGMTDLLLRRVFALRRASRVIRVTDDRQEPDTSSSL
jgi:hypothetical protein